MIWSKHFPEAGISLSIKTALLPFGVYRLEREYLVEVNRLDSGDVKMAARLTSDGEVSLVDENYKHMVVASLPEIREALIVDQVMHV